MTYRANSQFDLVALVDKLVGSKLVDRDLLVVSSKFVAISEGRVVSLGSVKVSLAARNLSARYGIEPRMCELILRESDEIIGGVSGFILAMKSGLSIPNAGIDKSNIEHGRVVLYPRKPVDSAISLRRGLKFRTGVDVGVIISDSRLMPTRRGTTGVALASSGLESIVDLRGNSDLFRNILRVTCQAVADDICSAAQLIMGESDERTPIVLVKGLDRFAREWNYDLNDFSIPSDECVYMRSLNYKPREKIRSSF